MTFIQILNVHKSKTILSYYYMREPGIWYFRFKGDVEESHMFMK